LKNLKVILTGKILLIILIAVSFIVGTFNPNFITVDKIEHNVATKYINEAKDIGLYQPEFLYENKEQFIKSLETCINFLNFSLHQEERIPKEIIIAQGVLESGYGTSRFAIQGNNLFGIRTWNLKEAHIKPSNNKDSKFGVKVFKTKCDCVKYYIKILNNHPAFLEFRRTRTTMILNNKIDTLKLAEKLTKFATDVDYVTKVKSTILKLRNERIQDTN